MSSIYSRLFVVVAFMLLVAKSVLCQAPLPQSAITPRYGLDSSALALFENGEELQWLRHFSGAFDDVFGVELSLAYDGVRCRGFVVYPQSNTRLRIDGTLSGEVLRLEERDPKTLVLSGTWTGTLREKQIRVEWSNNAETLSASLRFNETAAAPPDCGDNKWVNRYVARWNNSWAELALFRANNGLLVGNLYLQAEDQTFLLKGEIDEEGRYFLESPRLGGTARIELTGRMRYLQTTDCSWYAANGERRQFKFALKDNLLAGCLSYADYRSGLDIWYPRTTCTDCNQWLETRLTDWMTRTRTGIALLSDSVDTQRNILRATGWAEITCWSDDILSGYMLFSNSWGIKNEGIAFNFDLRTGEIIDIKDFFSKNFDYQTWLSEYARRESPKLPGYADQPDFRNWLYLDGFPLVSICHEGLMLSTYFHPVYGQQHVTVPFSLLKPYMKKESAVAGLVK